MTETQHDIRLADESTEEVEESRGQKQETVGATVTHMLANPRRVRRN